MESITSKKPAPLIPNELYLHCYGSFLKSIQFFIPNVKVESQGKGESLSRQQLEAIQKFREAHYKRHAAFLLEGDRTSELDNTLDLKSYHILAYEGKRLYGVLRITRHCLKYGLEKKATIKGINELSQYYEINRLVTKRTNRLLNKAFLCYAAAYTNNNIKGAGLVAVCKKERAKLFLKFGFTISDQAIFSNKEDAESYSLLNGSFTKMAKKNFRSLRNGDLL